MMNAKAWVDGMSVGVPELDEAHKALLVRLGVITEALNRQSFEEAEQTCRALIAYGVKHTAEEEAFLRRINYPNLAAVLEIQKILGQGFQRLLALIVERSPDARAFADKMLGDVVIYLLHGDINFKSFVQEMHDLGRLAKPAKPARF